jgi:hypothetical protein
MDAEAKARCNTQARLPNNVYLADINGDGLDDVLEINGAKIVARRSDFTGAVILDDYLTLDSRRVKRVITGDFTYAGRREKGKDQVCAILSDNNLACYAISDDGKSMWWWFTQGTFIADNEEAIVVDWTGDGADDILVYRPSDGNLRLYSLGITPPVNPSSTSTAASSPVRSGSSSTTAAPCSFQCRFGIPRPPSPPNSPGSSPTPMGVRDRPWPT